MDRVSCRGVLAAAFFLGWAGGITAPCAYAGLGGLPFDIDPNSLVSDDVVKALTNLIGFGLQHRPYEPATPLGLVIGLDFSIEATLVKIPDSFFTALSSSGFPLGTAPIPSLPIAKLHLHKGFGENVDLGSSAFYLPTAKIFGADAKIVFLQGEEDPTYALRFCYTYTDLAFSGINISTKTFSPQLLMSRQIDFADPYLGIGLEASSGTLDGSVPASQLPDLSQLPPGTAIPVIPPVHKTAIVYGGMLFGGVSLRVPRSGLRLTIEGGYSTAGTSQMGTKIGFTF